MSLTTQRSTEVALPVLLVAFVLTACDEPSIDDASTDESPSETPAPPAAPTSDELPVIVVEDSDALKLLAPRWEDWTADPPPLAPVPIDGLGAEAYHFKGIVYERADQDAKSTGVVRRGQRIAVKERVFGSGCEGGGWYSVEPYGYVCTKDGFWVSKTSRDPEPDAAPRPEQRIPYDYAKVISENAPRFFKIPDAPELTAARAASSGDGDPPEVVEKIMDGIYLLALRPKSKEGSERFRQTVRGRFVAEDDVEIRPNVPMRGEHISGKEDLPLAFTFGEPRKVYHYDEQKLEAVGVAEKHARMKVVSQVQVGEKSYVEGPGRMLLARQEVRVARVVTRPSRIPSGKKWIHVHLPEQTLVAYEGEQPAYATLVSSGQEGFDTPTGVYRIQHKYLSVTMSGPDPDEGFYEVEEVPWTMYYFESFALHGAYWHNDFGHVRSHGCTNIPPADARWLYYWSDPKVPAGWHAATRTPGTYVYITSDETD